MSDQPRLLTDGALDQAIEGSGLEQAFSALSGDDQNFYRGWVEEAKTEEDLLYRVRAVVRILHVWNKAL